MRSAMAEKDLAGTEIESKYLLQTIEHLKPGSITEKQSGSNSFYLVP
jgi:hypothetical protein